MSHRELGFWSTVGAVILFGVFPDVTLAVAGEDPRTAVQFAEGLRDSGLHELALDYIRQLRAEPGLPTKVKAILDYEEGRTLIDEAARSGDLVLREELLKDAREKLEGFVKANPQLAETRDALVHLGQAA